ncbi:HET-domain-containing protein [Diaporthe amygdali]|uniref:HET-domain-containing protein n=1 Tax=Phomopsis amygdali TaxID=1214568 RepID=UPI0022FDE335|nr:HET-domain-containing protein [Diaporthe amygdali]KAJ0122579.1 HET-domain-containing protein [Diaporthe amygdali]
MAESQHTHLYAPLPGLRWLRLLRILSVNEKEIVCSLEAFDMAKLPKYDCLSYTWGDPMSRDLYPPDTLQKGMSASCDRHIRHADGAIVKVTENLVQALRHLGESGYLSSLDNLDPLYLWIDAVCINQEDNDEKSSQVAMMDVIYRNAETVVIWLGEEDFHTEGALKTMRALAEVSLKGFEEAPFFDDYDAFTAYDTLLEAGKSLGLPDIEAGEWRDYAAFLQRKWFERIWVVQEKVFAQNTEVFVGHEKLSWDHIVKAASTLKQTGLANPLQALYLFALDGYDYYRNGRVSRLFEDRLNNHEIFADLSPIGSTHTTLETLLYYSKKLNATEPRDHVYAILSIWESSQDGSSTLRGIRVNYKSPIADVYAEGTALAIEETEDLGILALADHRTSTAAFQLPSWVPDYSRKAESQPLTRWPRNKYMESPAGRWNAGRGLRFRGQFDKSNRNSWKLPVRGLEVDTIEDIGPTYEQIDREYHWFSLLQILLDGCTRDQPTGEWSCYEAFWRTLIKDTFRNQPAGKEAENAFTTLIMHRVHGLWEGDSSTAGNKSKFEHKSDDEYESMCSLRDIESSFWVAYSGRRLFRTTKGFFGISNQVLDKGDSIWILAGAETPFILRKESGKEWIMVGEAYIHGLIGGRQKRYHISRGSSLYTRIDEESVSRVCSDVPQNRLKREFNALEHALDAVPNAAMTEKAKMDLLLDFVERNVVDVLRNGFKKPFFLPRDSDKFYLVSSAMGPIARIAIGADVGEHAL